MRAVQFNVEMDEPKADEIRGRISGTMFIDCSPLSSQNLYFVVISCRGYSKKKPRTAHFLAALRSGVCCQ